MKLFKREPKPVTYIGPAVPSVTRTVTKTLLAGIGLGGAAIGVGAASDAQSRKDEKNPKPKSTHPFA